MKNKALLGFIAIGLTVAACRPVDVELKLDLKGGYVEINDPALAAERNPVISAGGSGIEGWRRVVGALKAGVDYASK